MGGEKVDSQMTFWCFVCNSGNFSAEPWRKFPAFGEMWEQFWQFEKGQRKYIGGLGKALETKKGVNGLHSICD